MGFPQRTHDASATAAFAFLMRRVEAAEASLLAAQSSIVALQVATAPPAPFGSPSVANKSMAAELTAVDGAEACATGVAKKPIGYVAVAVNGVLVDVGNGVKTHSCYFSGDAGVTPRAFAAIAAGDKLYWVGSVAKFELATTDVVDFYFFS